LGLIYAPAESEALIVALKRNIEQSKEIVEGLEKASAHLLHALDSRTLTGMAYHAGRGMFGEVIRPIIRTVADGLKQAQDDLIRYEAADAALGNELLDEDLLNTERAALRVQETALWDQIDYFGALSRQHAANDWAQSSMMYLDFQQTHQQYLLTIEQRIQMVDEKLRRLHTFNDAVQGLFVDMPLVSRKMQQMRALLDALKPIGVAPFMAVNTDMLEAFGAEFKAELETTGLNPLEWLKSFISDSFEATWQHMRSGKNVGHVWAGAAWIQRFGATRGLASWLGTMSGGMSYGLAYASGIGYAAIIAYDTWVTTNDYKEKYGDNNGRSLAYAGVMAGTTIGAGVGVGITLASGPAVVAFVGSIVVGIFATAVVKTAYDYVPWFKWGVDGIGDGLNWLGTGIEQMNTAIGEVYNERGNIGRSWYVL
jgi:hypothetical protein